MVGRSGVQIQREQTGWLWVQRELVCDHNEQNRHRQVGSDLQGCSSCYLLLALSSLDDVTMKC